MFFLESFWKKGNRSNQSWKKWISSLSLKCTDWEAADVAQTLLNILEVYSQPPQPRPLRWAQRAGVSAAGSCSPAAQSAAAWRSSPNPDSSAECRSLPRWGGGRAQTRRVSWWVQKQTARERRNKRINKEMMEWRVYNSRQSKGKQTPLKNRK